jgi:radical SAM protein with 4Fe4S-binding SPASM domain
MLPLFHTLYFEATRNCNLQCRYCSTKSNTKTKYEDIPTAKVVDRILHPAWDLGTRMIDFSGGEFLLRKDAYVLLEEAHKTGFRISIVTNGTAVTQRNIDKLQDLLGDNLLISLGINSFDEANTDTRDNDYHKTLQQIQLLEKNNITINLCVTVGKFNADTFAHTIAKVDELKIPYNRIPFTPRNASCHALMFDKETMKNKIHPVLQQYFRGYVSYVPFFLDPTLYAEKTGQTKDLSPVPTNPSIGCWVGSFYGISPDGNVAPCPLLLDHVSGGNVLNENLRDILYDSALFKNVLKRETLKGKCGSCKFNYTCGGCRVMAYYQSGDIMAEDPSCFIDELSPEELRLREQETAKQFRNYQRMTSFGGVFRKDDEPVP